MTGPVATFSSLRSPRYSKALAKPWRRMGAMCTVSREQMVGDHWASPIRPCIENTATKPKFRRSIRGGIRPRPPFHTYPLIRKSSLLSFVSFISPRIQTVVMPRPDHFRLFFFLLWYFRLALARLTALPLFGVTVLTAAQAFFEA